MQSESPVPDLDAKVTSSRLTVLSSAGARSVMEELGPEFERLSGVQLIFCYDSAVALAKSIEEGNQFDIAVLTPSVISTLASSRMISDGDHRLLASVGVGVAIRRGAPKPDISTPDKLIAAFLAATRISFPAIGASGDHFRQVVDDLGLSTSLKEKLEPVRGLKEIELVAQGRATLGVQLISEIIAVDGVELVGPFPDPLQKITELMLVTSRNGSKNEFASSFVEFLSSEHARRIIENKGMTPP